MRTLLKRLILWALASGVVDTAAADAAALDKALH
jgi:hypothetical protein